MKPVWRIVAWTVFVSTLLVSLVVGAFVAWLMMDVVPAGSTITIDQERFVVPELTHAGHYLLVVLLVWGISLLIVAIAPVVVVLGLVVPAVLGALGIVLTVLVIALVLWPVYLGVRRLWKNGAERTTMT